MIDPESNSVSEVFLGGINAFFNLRVIKRIT